jgi:hypothetical protein
MTLALDEFPRRFLLHPTRWRRCSGGGYGSPETALLTATVIADGIGGFSITGDYTCPTTSVMAIYSWFYFQPEHF